VGTPDFESVGCGFDPSGRAEECRLARGGHISRTRVAGAGRFLVRATRPGALADTARLHAGRGPVHARRLGAPGTGWLCRVAW